LPLLTIYVIIEEMIKSFKCKETHGIFERRRSKKYGQFQEIALRKLLLLEGATVLDDLRIPPANRLEKLKGNRAGQYSIRINDQWRICFEWRDGHAFKVEIVDYH
jgi:proteic killer suppression protein